MIRIRDRECEGGEGGLDVGIPRTCTSIPYRHVHKHMHLYMSHTCVRMHDTPITLVKINETLMGINETVYKSVKKSNKTNEKMEKRFSNYEISMKTNGKL